MFLYFNATPAPSPIVGAMPVRFFETLRQNARRVG